MKVRDTYGREVKQEAINMGAFPIINVEDPTNDQDADTKVARNAAIAAAGLSSKIITATRDTAAASGDVEYTGVGFQPTSLVSFAYVSITAPGATANINSIGFADSSKACKNVYIVATSTGVASNGNSAYLIDWDYTVRQYAIVKSFDADGFTLTWTKVNSPTGTGTLYFLCLK